MENEKEIHISSTCDCSFHISLRDIIDIGLKPSIQNATTIIAASLLNTALFGNYTVDFLFMIGNVFTIARDLLLYETYKIISQEAISASIKMKEKDARGFILQENPCELLQQAIESQSYMYNSFDIGLLHQVSREAYGIYVKEFYKNGESYSGAESSMPFLSCINYNGDGTIISSGKDTVMIVLQQGQQVPNMGVLKQFDVGFKNTVKDKDKDDYQLQLGNRLGFFNSKKVNINNTLVFNRIGKTEAFSRYYIGRNRFFR